MDVIVHGMMFDLVDIVNSDVDSDAKENDPAFGSDAKHDVALC